MSYLLIEADMHHGEVRIMNLSQCKTDEEAFACGEDRSRVTSGNIWRVLRVENGAMIDLLTGKYYAETNMLTICEE